MVATPVNTPKKTAFIAAFLHANPTANHAAVRAAWQEAGHPGTISNTLVSKLRASLGLVGNIRRGRKPLKKRGAKVAPVPTNGAPQAAPGRRPNRLAEIETDLDRLIFKLMGLGGHEDVEEALRGIRRTLVVRGHNA